MVIGVLLSRRSNFAANSPLIGLCELTKCSTVNIASCFNAVHKATKKLECVNVLCSGI